MTARDEERRADAHLKIRLGGLVIKAGLADMSRDQLLGLLLDGRERACNPETAAQFTTRGAKALKE